MAFPQWSSNGGSIPSYADVTQQPASHQALYTSDYSNVTYQRAAVALRFDDGQNQDKTVVQPLLKSRWLPAGFAIIAGVIGGGIGTIFDTANQTASSAGCMAATDLQSLVQDGHEILCHSQTHNIQPTDYTSFVAETVTAQSNIANVAGGPFFVDHFAPPGPWNSPSTTGPYYFNQDSKYLTQSGSALKAAFPTASGYIFDGISDGTRNPYRQLPMTRRYGSGYMDGNSSTLAALEAAIDYCIAAGVGCEFVFHSWLFDTANNITTADFTTFLNYVQTKRDGGFLDVMSPSAMRFATRSDSKVDMIPGGSFSQEATGAFTWWTPTGAPTVATGGHSGGNLVKCDSANYVIHYLTAFGARRVRLEAWCKSDSGSAVFPRAIVRSINNQDSFTYTSQDVQPGSTTAWTKVAFNIGVHPSAGKIKVWLFAAAGSGLVDWSDPVLYRI